MTELESVVVEPLITSAISGIWDMLMIPFY